MIPLHGVGGGGVATSLDLRLSVAMVAGLLAVLGTMAVMRVQSDGYVPAYVGTAALWDTSPVRVSRSGATAVLVACGILAGLLFEVAVVTYERGRGAVGIDTEVVVATVARLSELGILLALVAVLYGFFSWVVFPRYGGAAYETRAKTVRRQWAISAAAYGVLFFTALTVLHAQLPV